jgi:hypothetical protein
LSPTHQDPDGHGVHGHSPHDRLSGRGCDDLHRRTGPEPDAHQGVEGPGPDPGARRDGVSLPGAAGQGGPMASGVTGMEGVAPIVAARRGRDRRNGPAGAHLRGADGHAVEPRPRPGWHCHRAIGAAELPSWATEVALTIERPLDLDPLGSAALVLLRAPPRSRWLTYLSEAAAEVEDLAGLGPVAGVDTAAGARPGARPQFGERLLSGQALAGLAPVTPAVAQASLAVAGARGLPAPLRRWRPAAGGTETSWRSSAGAVVTCEGPCGVSAQAVIALGGLGNPAAITPPPGGALVLRAWRDRRAWGVSCGLVIGAASALGLGREAGRAAAAARAEGWHAVVLTGAAALSLARAGSPARPAPPDAARAASGAQVAALVETCLAAGGVGRQSAGTRWALSVTP